MVSNKDVIIKVAKGTGTAVTYGAKGFSEVLFGAPTYIRKLLEFNLNETIYGSELKDLGYLFGSIPIVLPTVLSFGIVPILGYKSLFEYDAKIALTLLGTQLFTNLMSGFYEIGRNMKRQMMKEEQKKKHGLEEVIQKPEQKIHPSVPNPWDIDIPKIEDQKTGRQY